MRDRDASSIRRWPLRGWADRGSAIETLFGSEEKIPAWERRLPPNASDEEFRKAFFADQYDDDLPDDMGSICPTLSSLISWELKMKSKCHTQALLDAGFGAW